jgi:hypothetical protein
MLGCLRISVGLSPYFEGIGQQDYGPYSRERKHTKVHVEAVTGSLVGRRFGIGPEERSLCHSGFGINSCFWWLLRHKSLVPSSRSD